jgi:hypothetical protein
MGQMTENFSVKRHFEDRSLIRPMRQMMRNFAVLFEAGADRLFTRLSVIQGELLLCGIQRGDLTLRRVAYNANAS